MRHSEILVKNRRFNQPHLDLALPLGVIPSEFRGDFWRQKTRVPWLSYSVVCVILGLAIFVEVLLVTDRQTDRNTMTAYTALA